MGRLGVLVLGIMLATLTCSGCVSDSTIRLRDAYCDGHGHFNFTLASSDDEASEVEYHWTLNDPKADEPVLSGDGEASVRRGGPVHVSVELPSGDGDGYDSRFYVMYITVREEGKRVVEYREQKSPYDWDYSTLPPRREG